MKSRRTEKLKVVIDTNIIISAPLSEDSNPAKIFELLLLEEIKNFTSSEIIEEAKEVFNREKIKTAIPQDKINFVIKNFEKFSRFVEPIIKLNIVKDDIKDNMILECAETGNADYIISGDEHLKKLKQYKNIKIISPKEFLVVHL